jgi:putative tryptophan/tyrosine transport system substrate-binding protein
MRRREFITLIGTAAGWPLAVSAQQPTKIFKIGFIATGGVPLYMNAFHDELQALGWIEGKNVIYEARYAENRLDRLPELVTELLRLNIDIIVAGGTPAPLAAKRATATVPIVMAGAADPLGSGLVASLARPGGNVTGLSPTGADLVGKRLELLKEVLPGLSSVAILWNADHPFSTLVFKETERAAQGLRIEVQSLEVRSPNDIDRALITAMRQNASALIAIEDPLTTDYRHQIADFAAENRLPAIYGLRMFVDAGGLLSYGADLADLYRRAARYVDKILKGAKPSDLPVEQPTKFELVVNLKTAKALGLAIPATVLATADEVIE